MKKVLIVVLVICLLIGSIPASAYEMTAGKDVLKNADVEKKLEDAPFDVLAVADTFEKMLSDDMVVIQKSKSNKGTISKIGGASTKNERIIIDTINELLEIGALCIDSNGDLYTPDVKENVIDDVKKYYKKEIKQDVKAMAGSRSIETIDLIGMCDDNYSSLQTVYWVAFAAGFVVPGVAPWSTTVIYWVNKVREGGDWDYKRLEGFSPWDTEFYTYYDGYRHTVTSEYIGNFNYGYTGSYLFDLYTLYYGSYAVSGFDAADVEDWPAITDGYNHAP